MPDPNPGIKIEYIAGDNAGDGKSESYAVLDDKYIMKGYLLKISTNEAVKPNTDVTWIITKGGDEVGTYHPNGGWLAYGTPLENKPTTNTIYWRSDTGGSITDEYCICAKYIPDGGTDEVRAARKVESRLLDPGIPSHRNDFNEDADMVQRAMLQVLYINKGRLTSYRIGQFDQGSQNGWYIVSATKKWSAIADEVSNFHQFAMNVKPPSTTLIIEIVTEIWRQFGLILDAGAQPAQDRNTPAYSSTWLPNAVAGSGLHVPNGFSKTASETLDAQIRAEGGIHSYTPFAPLAVSNVQIGENNAGSGTNLHAFTDAGLGFSKVQPYNAATRNLYRPNENLLRGAEILEAWMDAAEAIWVMDANMIVWRAVFAYNHGSLKPNKTPSQLRTGTSSEQHSATYADRIFQFLNITPPD